MVWHYLHEDWSTTSPMVPTDHDRDGIAKAIACKTYPHTEEFVMAQFNCIYYVYLVAKKRWMAQYQFWSEYEREHGVPWTGGSPSTENTSEEWEFPDYFGPASRMSTPRGWLFPLPKRWFGSKAIKHYRDLDEMPDLDLFEFDETGEITHCGQQNDLGVELSTVQVDQTPQPNESYFGRGCCDQVLPSNAMHSDNSWDEVLPSDYSGGDWTDQPMTITEPPNRTTYHAVKNLRDVHLLPDTNAQLLGFETTKLQISSHAQETLKSNRYHELSNLEHQSQARILIFDPYRAQDGRVSDTTLVFIQGSPYARHQTVKLLTAFQANLEAGSMESNVNFTFLGPGRSRERKEMV
ncbi:hypothetical protein BCON_0503g00040 [Botryotinia convoluta]|uniref:Uncharacterized protein n=1 Tax=Botryotinia convoluta TaxID=54673 RepID=A0A4Z1HAM8_9HELO|nr:hypothetical protein BCON_0503g00040 [Botryotinia convoluta]